MILSLQPVCIHIPIEVTMPALADVLLQEMWDWELLGLKLGIPDSYLKEIEHDFNRLSKRKYETMRLWLRIDKNHSWSKLVVALVHINERHLAWTIAEKYGKSFSVK